MRRSKAALALWLLVGIAPSAAAQDERAGWPATLERISTGVVTIQIDATRATSGMSAMRYTSSSGRPSTRT
jgi:hypothetical protein